MKNSLKISVAVGLVVCGLSGCATTKPSPFGFDYAVDNPTANGIVQVFDLAGNTIVQMRGLNPATTHFKDQRNAEIPHDIVGENVVLKGIQPIFTVSTALALSKVVRTAPMPAPVQAAAAASNSTDAPADQADRSQFLTNAGLSIDSSNEELLAEISRIKKEIASLKAAIASAESAGIRAPDGNGQLSVELAQARARPDKMIEASDDEVIRVFFKDNSHSFAPDVEARARILDLVKSAHTVEVTGYTDTSRASALSEALAKSRAEAARRYLMRRGVDGKKIRVGYEAAGKFIADNGSAKGKATNRRVEIRGS